MKNPPTTLQELDESLREIIPGCQIEQDNYGQIIVYTNLMPSKQDDQTLVDFE